jgi:SAM-dependent methyltransferase
MNRGAIDADASAYRTVRFPFDPARARVWRVLCSYLQRWVDPAQPLLDLGAGYGDFSRFIRAREKWALDADPGMAAYWPEDARPLIRSATAPLPFPGGSLGTVFASNFFEHFTREEASAILDETRRVLSPGGRLIAVQPNFRLEPARYFDDYTHRTPFTDRGFAGLAGSRGFEILHSEPRFTPFSMESRWPTAAWMVRAYLALPWRPLAGQFLVVAGRGRRA